MAVESATYISDLVTTNPTHADSLGQTDLHLRIIKSVLKQTFTGITGAVTATHTDLNTVPAANTRLTALEANRLRNDTSQSLTGNLSVTGKLQESGNPLIPHGVIVAWSGLLTAIPAGWALCDGTNGTPNLVGAFIMGAGVGVNAFATGGAYGVTATTTYAGTHSHAGGTGGAGAHAHSGGTDVVAAHSHGGATGSHQLTISEMPAHDHALTGLGGQVIAYATNPVLQAFTGTDMGGFTPQAQGGNTPHSHTIAADGAHGHAVATTSVGDHVHSIQADGGHTHTISISTTPPYMALGFIMKL